MLKVVCIFLGLGLFEVKGMEDADTLDPLVDAPAGLIKGLWAEDGNYSMYLGIPYAQIGDNPFGIAEAYPKFETIFDANEDPPACPQTLGGNAIGSLDCLRINVFVPSSANNNTSKLPVVIWIYGGTFNSGFTKRNHFGPEYFIREDVIFVSFNYRVGPYGFMCLDTPDVPGNQGLKDQLLALRWVRENIDSFGGDANQITLMGESAGGISIDFHIMSKHEKYFNKAIIQSGGALRPVSIIDSDLSVPLKISEQLDFKTDNVSEALAFLATADPKLVIAACNERSITLKPCIEKEFENVDRFVIDYPWNLDVPKAEGMELLIGFNNNEGLIRYSREAEGYFMKQDYFLNSLKYTFDFDDSDIGMENIVRHFYFGGEMLSEKLKDKVLEFESDYFYGYAAPWTAEKMRSQGANNVYLYLFSYDGGRNYIKNNNNIEYKGAAHSDEIGYLFDMDDNKIVKNCEDDQLVSDYMSKLWTNFVKYGNPTPETSDLLPTIWTPITNDTMNYMDINSEMSMKKQPFYQRMAFWELYYKANEKKLKGFHKK